MKGDKKNKTGHNKLKELVYRLSSRKDFQEDVNKIREKYKIKNLQNNEIEYLVNWIKINESKILPLSLDTAKITRKYKIPFQNFNYILGYILTENTIKTTELINESATECIIVQPNSKLRYGPEQVYEEAGIKYIKLLITEQASVRDVKNYLDRNWYKIKAYRKEQGVDSKQIRATQQKARNKRICELMRASREELGLKKGDYKEVYIAKIITKEFGPTSEDTIKSISKKCRRYNK